ncbi:transglycosylase SLT domain-containing protein [Aliikangiella sp. G2MR2-5]|uniref:transglycosylase SLT domain-containing protein n=1 Tax=Aliikangiella sp. G2MR2-5 TaxID=2788943 RepID=UPI0018A88ECF|nr:transglycosylase SLT domain-containing protein [Aliikangiella sp. G2MR2-5]
MNRYRTALNVLASCLLLFVAGSSLAAKQERPSEEFRKKLQYTIAKAESSFKDRFDAEVWLVEQSQRLARVAAHIPEDERLTILRLVHQEATNFELDPMLVLALIQVESAFDHYAVSNAGARGLMQVMPFWKDELGKPGDSLFDIETNLRYGCAILSLYLEKEKKNTTRALARYNGSLGQSWYPMRVYKKMRKVWRP